MSDTPRTDDMRGDYTRGTCPIEPAHIVTCADIGQDKQHWTTVAFDANGQSFVLDYGIARGNHVVPVEFAEDLEREIMTMSRLCDHLSVCSKRSQKWRCVDEDLPDDDQTVLIHLQCGEVWTGFHEAGQWRFVSADPISEPVLHWMPFPEAPEL